MQTSHLVLPALLLPFALGTACAQVPERMTLIDRGSLCVTEGEIAATPANQLSVESTKMRAYVNKWTTESIEARFTYLGGTQDESRLGSGEIRRQFGLKMRAQNACNLVYAMWRIEPESKLVVSVKKNPGQIMSSECGDHGYQNIKPRRAVPVPMLRPDDTHTLTARFAGNDLTVSVDGREVWEGDLGMEAGDLNGPVGIRSDNVRLALDLKAGAGKGMHPDFRLACKSGPGVSD